MKTPGLSLHSKKENSLEPRMIIIEKKKENCHLPPKKYIKLACPCQKRIAGGSIFANFNIRVLKCSFNLLQRFYSFLSNEMIILLPVKAKTLPLVPQTFHARFSLGHSTEDLSACDTQASRRTREKTSGTQGTKTYVVYIFRSTAGQFRTVNLSRQDKITRQLLGLLVN